MAHRTWAWLWCATLAIAPSIANAKLTSTHLSHPAYHGFPDCTLGVDGHTDTCAQRPATADNQTLVACVGDSITAGYRASSSAHTYPSVLASLLGERYRVTNLGEGGATMQVDADSPYWLRAGFRALTAAKWDVIILMLGTNDAKDAGSRGPPNWPHDCAGAGALACPFAADYSAFLALLAKLGRAGKPPAVWVMRPPPLWRQGDYGMNQTVINRVLPALTTALYKATPQLAGIVDIFGALGGDGMAGLAPTGCAPPNASSAASPAGSGASPAGSAASPAASSAASPAGQPAGCALFCDAQSCDQCHPNDAGYRALAGAVRDAVFPARGAYAAPPRAAPVEALD